MTSLRDNIIYAAIIFITGGLSLLATDYIQNDIDSCHRESQRQLREEKIEREAYTRGKLEIIKLYNDAEIQKVRERVSQTTQPDYVPTTMPAQ